MAFLPAHDPIHNRHDCFAYFTYPALGAFYRWRCLPSWESSFYFSAASYSTVGYGDVVLPRFWRVLGPLESVTGVLMCAISVSALFAILIHLLESETQSSSEIRMGPPSLADQPLDADSVNDMG